MGQKEDENLATEKRRVADLAFLNSVGGPFTNENDVEEYVKSEKIKDSMLRSDLQETAPSRFQRTQTFFD